MATHHVCFSSAAALLQQLNEIREKDPSPEIVVQTYTPLYDPYETLAGRDIIMMHSTANIRVEIQGGCSSFNLVLASGVSREKRFINKHSLCHFIPLQMFGFGTYKDLKITQNASEELFSRVKSGLKANYDLSETELEDLYKDQNFKTGDELSQKGINLLSNQVVN